MTKQTKVIPIETGNPKIESLVPLEEIESEAMNQIFRVLSFDFVKKIAIMPDIHVGYFLPIGCVALVEGQISPAMVGFDIGCGMSFIDTGLKTRNLLRTKNDKEKVMKRIINAIPIGKGSQHINGLTHRKFVSASGDSDLNGMVTFKEGLQLGTLGGGNHFIEIGENSSKNVCVIVHSGSRNPGRTIGGFYMNKGLFFDEDSALGRAYIIDMKWALDYALLNRKIMLYEILIALGIRKKKIQEIMKNMINENHNTATKTKEGWLHRKGATPAEKDQLGVIPGNMGDGVAITIGLGDEKYLKSASHGAGRRFSRSHAKKNLSMKMFEKKMKGIVSNGITDKNLDESPAAYKDFEKVLSYQDDIVVNILDRIRPLINIKG